MSTVSHEGGHVKTRRRYALEILGVMGAVLAVSFVLAFFTILLVVQIFEVALLLLAINFVSWRNERRADTVVAESTACL